MPETPSPKKDATPVEAIGLVWEIIAMITIPTLVFALGGRWLDQRFGATPLFLAFGLLLTLIVLTIIITKKGKDIVKKLYP